MKVRFIVPLMMAVMVCGFSIAAAQPETKTAAAAKNIKSQATPSDTVKTFCVAMSKADYATAKKCVNAKEIVKMLTSLEEMLKEMPELKQEFAAEFANMAKIKIVSEKITGDTAEVTFTYVEKNKTKRETFKLKKVGKNWLIVE